MASGSDDKTVCLWDAASGTLWRKLAGHGEVVQSVQWSADGNQLASGSYSYDSYGSPHGKTCIWEVASGKLLATQPEGKNPRQSPLRSERAGLIASLSSSHSAIYLHDAASGERLRAIGGPGVWAVAWSPDETLLVSLLLDEMAQLWDTATATLRHSLGGHTGYGRLAWSPDGKRLATSGNDKVICLWDTASGALLHRLSEHTNHVKCIAWSADGKLLATGANDFTVRLWDTTNGQLMHTLSTPESHLNFLSGVWWSPNGKQLTSVAGDGRLRIWEVANGALLRTINENENFMVRELAWSADGTLLAGASWQNKIRLWEAARGKLLHQLEVQDRNVDLSADSPDKKLLAMLLPTNLVSVAFSPDQKLLVSGCQKGDVSVWSLETGAELQTFSTNLAAYELKEVAFVAAPPRAYAYGQTPYGEPEIIVSVFPLNPDDQKER